MCVVNNIHNTDHPLATPSQAMLLTSFLDPSIDQALMRTSLLVTTALLALGANAQTTHDLANQGFTFNPAVLTIQAGDSIRLVLGSPHTCTQVSQATWNANGNTPNGGFNFSAGTHTFALSVPGTYYYVCIPHASSGMKGQIIVLGPNSVEDAQAKGLQRMFPNPASTFVTLDASMVGAGNSLAFFDLNGRKALQVSPLATPVVNVGRLAPGTYMMVVSDAQGAMLLQERVVIAP
jgi:plastocyanin